MDAEYTGPKPERHLIGSSVLREASLMPGPTACVP